MAQNKSGYTSAEIVSMQKDAMRRVSEMQKLSKARVQPEQNLRQNLPQNLHQNLHQEPPTPITLQNFPTQNEQSHTSNNDLPQAQGEIFKTGGLFKNLFSGSSFSGILEKLPLDSEQILIGVLIFILMSEGADVMLLLALGYILL